VSHKYKLQFLQLFDCKFIVGTGQTERQTD